MPALLNDSQTTGTGPHIFSRQWWKDVQDWWDEHLGGNNGNGGIRGNGDEDGNGNGNGGGPNRPTSSTTRNTPRPTSTQRPPSPPSPSPPSPPSRPSPPSPPSPTSSTGNGNNGGNNGNNNGNGNGNRPPAQSTTGQNNNGGAGSSSPADRGSAPSRTSSGPVATSSIFSATSPPTLPVTDDTSSTTSTTPAPLEEGPSQPTQTGNGKGGVNVLAILLPIVLVLLIAATLAFVFFQRRRRRNSPPPDSASIHSTDSILIVGRRTSSTPGSATSTNFSIGPPIMSHSGQPVSLNSSMFHASHPYVTQGPRGTPDRNHWETDAALTRPNAPYTLSVPGTTKHSPSPSASGSIVGSAMFSTASASHGHGPRYTPTPEPSNPFGDHARLAETPPARVPPTAHTTEDIFSDDSHLPYGAPIASSVGHGYSLSRHDDMLSQQSHGETYAKTPTSLFFRHSQSLSQDGPFHGSVMVAGKAFPMPPKTTPSSASVDTWRASGESPPPGPPPKGPLPPPPTLSRHSITTSEWSDEAYSGVAAAPAMAHRAPVQRPMLIPAPPGTPTFGTA